MVIKSEQLTSIKTNPFLAMFKMHSKYFRNALARANYADYPNRIAETDEYLIRFYTNLLTDQKTALRNRDLILRK